MNKSRVISTVALIFVGFLFLLLIASGSFITIEAGQKGVLFRKFNGGLDFENVYSQGFHVIAPWNEMIPYNVRIQELSLQELEVLTTEGMTIKLDLTLLYRPEEDNLPQLHNTVGLNYADRIIVPEIRAVVREVIGKYDPEELYKGRRDSIQNEIEVRTEASLSRHFIDVDAVRLRNVVLPETIRQAIESKLQAKQESQKYNSLIEKEVKEAERKRIEAEGIREYQKIVSQSLSQQLLKWQGIEATKELANSPNSKVVLVGGGDSGLPLILGGN
ncbi:prohibitin family protein [Pontibacter sp. G13]|uniref:prohibitin family protein n=1 Tax=Pontibacter sp. G13 TaxID=3074898 RepID=UPI00288C4C9F|nr:prohibitin family protein [Pontibacter sp. G13]WNJ16723.1 prohibitin family protein [Pontibacter sp. G13]